MIGGITPLTPSLATPLDCIACRSSSLSTGRLDSVLNAAAVRLKTNVDQLLTNRAAPSFTYPNFCTADACWFSL